jgi:hypothetical protein
MIYIYNKCVGVTSYSIINALICVISNILVYILCFDDALWCINAYVCVVWRKRVCMCECVCMCIVNSDICVECW